MQNKQIAKVDVDIDFDLRLVAELALHFALHADMQSPDSSRLRLKGEHSSSIEQAAVTYFAAVELAAVRQAWLDHKQRESEPFHRCASAPCP